MKPKRTKTKCKPSRAQRDSLDKRIAKVATLDEKLRLAAFGRATIPDGFEVMVRAWKTIRHFRANKSKATPEERTDFQAFAADAEKQIGQYVISAMAHNRPDMLVDLADEMKRQNKPDWLPAVADISLLQLGKAGPVNLTHLARAVAEYEKRGGNYAKVDVEDRADAVRKTLQRKANRYKIKTVTGRPKK